jgi:hypothetical protein
MTRDAELALDGLEAGDPQARGLVVLLGFLALVALQFFIIVVDSAFGFSR